MSNAEGDRPALWSVGDSASGVVDVLDQGIRRLIDPAAPLTRLADGCVWTEGPVYLPDDDAVLFSDIPNDRVLRWSATDGTRSHLQPAEFANGHTLDRDGRLLTCEHGSRRVSILDVAGVRRTVVDRYLGRRLNSPNDIVVKSDGSIWFTDPPYGILSDREGHKAPSELGDDFVFRYDPQADDLSVVSADAIHPNGLAFSPDESLLYVADSSAAVDARGNHCIFRFDVIDGVRLSTPSQFFVTERGWPDGLRLDVDGNIWTSAGDGIHILSPDGRSLGRIRVPEVVSNCVFGGRDGRRLFITASTSLYVIDVLTLGAGVAAEVARRHAA